MLRLMIRFGVLVVRLVSIVLSVRILLWILEIIVIFMVGFFKEFMSCYFGCSGVKGWDLVYE